MRAPSGGKEPEPAREPAEAGEPRRFLDKHLRNADHDSCWTMWPYARRWGEQPSISCVHPLTGKRWNGPVRTLGWYLIYGAWPQELQQSCTTHACWNPRHTRERHAEAGTPNLEHLSDEELLTELRRRGLLPLL